MLFTDIIGQEQVKKRLVQTVNDNRVSHAQLFLGPEGSGKLALALAYAQYINCENRKNKLACNTCPSCVKYKKLIHPDLHFIFPVATSKKVPSKPKSKEYLQEWRELLLEKQMYISLPDWYNKIEIENKQAIINADDCNEIIKTLGYKSYESEYKVMVIWMVEKLYHAAGPKILKILEEPPDKTLFLLISENQDLIIPTILSRTQIVKIPPVDDTSMLAALRERFDITGTRAQGIVNFSEGNFRKATEMAVESDDAINYFPRFRDWMRLCFQGDKKVKDLIGFVEEVSHMGREKQKSFLSFSLGFIRQCMLLQYNSESVTRFSKEEKEFVANFARFIHSANIQHLYREMNDALFHIERNANPSVLFLDLSLKTGRLLKTG